MEILTQLSSDPVLAYSVLGALVVSELMSLSPKLKDNGILQFVYNILSQLGQGKK